jgi:hypothetical protein
MIVKTMFMGRKPQHQRSAEYASVMGTRAAALGRRPPGDNSSVSPAAASAGN